MKIRFIYEEKINDEFVPNGMSKNLREKYVDSLIKNNVDSFTKKFVEENNFTFPYSSYFILGTTNESDLLSDFDETSSDILGANKVVYLYYIGTAGNISDGLNVKNRKNHKSYFENLSETVISYLINKNNFYLFINQTQEKITIEDCEKIYKECIRYKIPFNKIIVCSDIFNYNIILEQIEKKYNIKYDIKYFTFPWQLYQAAEMLDSLFENNNIVKDVLFDKKNKILCLNKNLRYNRILILSYLLANDYERDCLISFDTKFLTDNHFDEKNWFNNKYNLLKGYKKLLNIKKQVLDVDNLDNNFNLLRDKKYLYESTYLSIVTETELDSLRMTEKTFKPIINYHPFIIWGAPSILKILRYYNFKTFDGYLDESYDSDAELLTRLDLFFKNIDYVMKMTNEELNKFTENVKNILIYNRNLLYEYKHENIRKEYFDNLLKLIDNTFSNEYYSIISPKTHNLI